MTNADITIPAGYNRQEYFSTCYECSHTRKYKPKDKCLSIRAQPGGDVVQGTYHCNHCHDSGLLNQFKTKTDFNPMYQVPDKRNFTTLSDEALQFFTGRGITQEVVMANKIVEEKGWVVFPYLENGQLVNVKKRSRQSKDFRQWPDAKPIMFNYDRCVGQKEILVVEGELDGMAFEVAGFTNHTSVNQGAPNANDKNIDKKLECITNSYEMFEQAETVYIAVDKDDNGKRLEEELVRRIGSEKCKLVTWPGNYKDANEVLLYEGAQALKDAIAQAKDVKVEGIWTVDDVREEMLHSFRHGKKRGTTTYFPEIDARWTWRTGEVNIWTGYNNEGKTQLFLQFCLAKAMAEGWKFAVFSPENIPVGEFFDDLIHTYIGKSTDSQFKNVMSEEEYQEGMDFMLEHFYIIYPPKDFTIDTIEEKFKYLIRRKGIRVCLLDPYNQIEHLMKGGEREDLYISRFMARMTRFARENDISYNLIAHQTTPQALPDGNYPKPKIYAIKGGGTFSDKADNVLVAHRPLRGTDPTDTTVDFYSEKIKKQRLVGVPGSVLGMDFDRATNRYKINNYSPISILRDKMILAQMEARGHDEAAWSKPSSMPASNFDEEAPNFKPDEPEDDNPYKEKDAPF